MRLVLQRVKEAAVKIGDRTIASIGQGFLLLVGFTHTDNESIVEAMARKVIGLRIFEDAEGKMNLSIWEVKGALLVVSQFTLYADTRKGRRPAFTEAAPPQQAYALYNYFLRRLEREGVSVSSGQFGAKMIVHLINDGPVTLILDSENLPQSNTPLP